MNGMIEDILRLEEPDFKSLVETRILLELKTARLAALRRTDEDLLKIKEALDAYAEKVNNGEDAVQEDLLFHLAIAKACGNSTMNTFMLIITPEIITNFEKYHVCDTNLAQMGIKDHTEIYEAIKDQNPKLAKEKMKEHFKILYQYCYNI
jgi:GntR family transcriptional repressor for pyruvate dehydrogenase complex